MPEERKTPAEWCEEYKRLDKLFMTCTICKEPATQFKDDLSRREYRISGMCQACQDEVFSSSEEY